MTFGIRRIAHALLIALIVLAPMGTRFIMDVAHVDGVPIESSTHSVFLTELIALAFICAAIWRSRRSFGALAYPERLGVGLLALSVLSAAFSADPYRASALTIRLAIGVALFIAISRASIPSRMVLWALVIAAAVQGTAALVQVYGQHVPAASAIGVASQLPSDLGVSVVETSDGRWLRAYGTLPHPNILGIVAVIGTLAGAALMVEFSSVRAAAGLTGLAFFGALLSFSRSAILALVAGSAALFVEAVRNPALRARCILVGSVLVIAAVTVVGAVPETWHARATATGRLEGISVTARERSVRDAVDLIADSPLFGAGPGLSQQGIAALYPSRDGWQIEPPHAMPLVIAAEAGLFALVMWLLFIASLLATALRALKNLAMTPFVAMMAAVAMASLFDHYFWTTWPGTLMFWLVCGLFWAHTKGFYGTPVPDPAER